MRSQYKQSETRERRVGYLKAQSAALANEFRKLGEVAGVAGKRDRHFNHEDPSSSGVLTDTLKANDVRNESSHAFLQVKQSAPPCLHPCLSTLASPPLPPSQICPI